MSRNNQQGRGKRFAAIALAVCLVLVAVGGTIAWLTASNKVTNNFTVGQITKPDPGPANPDKPDPNLPDPGKGDDNGNQGKMDGNIYEVFSKDPNLIPGGEVTKAPYIGIGKGSEDAYVFAYVDNKMMADTADLAHSTYFTLGKGWAPVAGKATEYTGDGASDKTYTSGLFVWVNGGTDPAPLVGQEGEATWTGELFGSVQVPAAAGAADFAQIPTMDVHCFIYAVGNKKDDKGEAATAAATKWVDGGLKDVSGTVAPK